MSCKSVDGNHNPTGTGRKLTIQQFLLDFMSVPVLLVSLGLALYVHVSVTVTKFIYKYSGMGFLVDFFYGLIKLFVVKSPSPYLKQTHHEHRQNWN